MRRTRLHAAIRRGLPRASRSSTLLKVASCPPLHREQPLPHSLNSAPCRVIAALRENCRSEAQNAPWRVSFVKCCARCCNHGSTSIFPVLSSGWFVRRSHVSSGNQGLICEETIPGSASVSWKNFFVMSYAVKTPTYIDLALSSGLTATLRSRAQGPRAADGPTAGTHTPAQQTGGHPTPRGRRSTQFPRPLDVSALAGLGPRLTIRFPRSARKLVLAVAMHIARDAVEVHSHQVPIRLEVRPWRGHSLLAFSRPGGRFSRRPGVRPWR